MPSPSPEWYIHHGHLRILLFLVTDIVEIDGVILEIMHPVHRFAFEHIVVLVQPAVRLIELHKVVTSMKTGHCWMNNPVPLALTVYAPNLLCTYRRQTNCKFVWGKNIFYLESISKKKTRAILSYYCIIKLQFLYPISKKITNDFDSLKNLQSLWLHDNVAPHVDTME